MEERGLFFTMSDYGYDSAQAFVRHGSAGR